MRATTQLQDSLFLPRVPLTSDSGTLQNGLQLNPDKSEALVVGTAHQLYVVDSSVSSVSVADVDLPVAEDMKVFGVVLDRRLTFWRFNVSWRRSIVVRTLVSAGELSLSCARLLAG